MVKTVLIVNNSESILRFLEKEISRDLNIRILKTTNFKEAINYILEEKVIHIAIVDFDLLGAQNGQVLNYTIRKNIPSIIFSKSFTEKLKIKISEKSIIEYIIKDSSDSIYTAINIAIRILKNYDTNIILADDSPLHLGFALEKLNKMKLNVTTAVNGKEVFELIAKADKKYSLILTDYMMPVMDGMELTLELRKIYKKDNLGIIVLSSSDKPEVSSAFIKIGANDFINKPYSDIEFTTRINSNLELLDIFEQSKQKDKQLYRAEKMASMGEMIGNIAHQWRQPLSVISTASSGMQLQKELETLSDEKFNEACESINKNALYLSKTIDDFRDFIKGDRKKSIFKLEDEIYLFLTLIEGTIKTNDISIIQDLQKGIKIDGYQNELTQCLINIFNNAKDILISKEIFDKSDSTSTYKDKLIFISTSIQDDGRAVIKIKDNAGGIPEDILPKIFEPYFTTKHQSVGTGLGLHMTYNLIVDGMNGTIEANNVEYVYDGKNYVGAEFTISFPMM